MNNSNDLRGGLFWAQVAATGASIVGSIWMMGSCYKAPTPVNDIVILVGAIAASDLIYAIPNVLSIINLESLCPIEGFMRELYLVSMFLVTATAILTFRKTKERVQGREGGATSQRSFVYVTIICSTILSLLICSLPFIFTNWFIYGETNIHCWITAPAGKEALQITAVLIFEIIPVVLGIVITCYFYYRARKITSDSFGSFLTQTYHLYWYPLILFVVFVPSIIDDLITATRAQDLSKDKAKGQGVIEMIHILFTHSIGLTNAILYRFQKKRIHSQNHVGLSMQGV